MPRPWPWIVVAIVFSMLAFAASAHAASAWVLWEQTITLGEPVDTWELLDATDTKAMCLQQVPIVRNARISFYKKWGWTIFDINEGAFEAANERGSPIPKGKLKTVAYSCWPDTVDPRGPKGK